MYTCIVRILGTPVEVDTSVQQFLILWGCQTYF